MQQGESYSIFQQHESWLWLILYDSSRWFILYESYLRTNGKTACGHLRRIWLEFIKKLIAQQQLSSSNPKIFMDMIRNRFVIDDSSLLSPYDSYNMSHMVRWVIFYQTGQKDSFYMVDGKKRARRFDRNNYHQFTVITS